MSGYTDIQGVKDAVTDGAAGSLMERAGAAMPDISNLYLEPLNPGSDITIKDRASLVLQSARPWREFFDISSFNLPPLDELKLRVGHNIETYFYNYFLLACLYMVLFAFGHFPSVLALTGVLALAFYLYILHPEDIKVTDSVTITTTIKHVVVVVVGLLALTVGHVFTLFVSLCIFLLIVAGSHSIIREHTV